MLMTKIVRVIINKRLPWSVNIPQLVIYRSVNHSITRVASFPYRQYTSGKICPPDQKQKSSGGGGGGRGGKFVLALGAIALAGGATLGYAKYDPEFRKTLTEYVPFTDTILNTISREDGIYGLYDSLKQSVVGTLSGQQEVDRYSQLKDAVPEPEEYKAPPPIVPALEKEVKKQQESYSEIRVEKKEKGSEEPKIEIAGDPKPSEAKETDAKVLAELEEKICQSATEAVNAYNKAIHVLKSYNQDIEYIIDQAVNDVTPEVWDSIKTKTKSKTECLRRAREKADEASKDVNRLKEIISRPDFEAAATTKELIRNNIAKVQEDIDKAKRDLENELKRGNVTEKYWDKVEKARKNFSEELEILFPSIDLTRKELTIDPEDLDLFILHTYAHVLFYQKELAKMETVLQSRVAHAVDVARKGGLEPLTVAQICEAVEQEKRRLTLCFQQQVLKLRQEAEMELREQLKRQSQAFSDHLNDAIKTREMEIERDLTRKFDEQLEEERCRFKLQLATMVGRLRGLDESIKARNDADESSRQAQVLWSACQSLLRAIRAGCPGMPWKEQIRSLEPEINAVRKSAAENDELVHVVLEAIPKEAVDRGVYPEDALRERFLKVEKVARTVALIPEQGAALPVHILSYIQSLLLIKAASPIPQAELRDEQVDFSKLNTNDILQRARYWLDRGDFTQALKYMNLLKGAPRCVARQWMNETRILLETQQAANALMAHAASSGLLYL